MKRKIVKHGPISLTVSLPSKWVKKRNLKAGDEVEVEEHNNGLFIGDFNNKKEHTKKEII